MLGDYPSSGVVFLDPEQLNSMGVQDHMAPPFLSHLLTLPPSPLPPLCCLEKWQLHIKKLGTHPVAFWGLTFMK